MLASISDATEKRDLKEYCAQLLKDIERKDSKIDSLIRELQSVRSVVIKNQVLCCCACMCIHSVTLTVRFTIINSE